jgi:hypothetical protein
LVELYCEVTIGYNSGAAVAFFSVLETLDAFDGTGGGTYRSAAAPRSPARPRPRPSLGAASSHTPPHIANTKLSPDENTTTLLRVLSVWLTCYLCSGEIIDMATEIIELLRATP